MKKIKLLKIKIKIAKKNGNINSCIEFIFNTRSVSIVETYEVGTKDGAFASLLFNKDIRAAFLKDLFRLTKKYNVDAYTTNNGGVIPVCGAGADIFPFRLWGDTHEIDMITKIFSRISWVNNFGRVILHKDPCDEFSTLQKQMSKISNIIV